MESASFTDNFTDFTKEYRPRRGTIRKCFNRYYNADYEVRVNRPFMSEGYPISPIDMILDPNIIRDNCEVSRFNHNKVYFSLRKKNLFDDFISEIEEIAVNRVESVDKSRNQFITTYSVPAIGYIPKTKSKLSGLSGYDFGHFAHSSTRYIPINGVWYSNQFIYRQDGNAYIKLNVPESYIYSTNTQPPCDDNEQHFCPISTNFNRANNSFTIKYHHEISISSISIHPEKLKLKYIHGDNGCGYTCSKSKHCISVLANDPGYISKFNLYYRSSNTDGKWIAYGTYDGCTNMYAIKKVQFDEISVKEIRIVPTSTHGNVSKCKIFSIGPASVKCGLSPDTLVKYELVVPLDGKAMQTRVSDNYSYSNNDDRHYYNKIRTKQRKATRALSKSKHIDDYVNTD